MPEAVRGMRLLGRTTLLEKFRIEPIQHYYSFSLFFAHLLHNSAFVLLHNSINSLFLLSETKASSISRR